MYRRSFLSVWARFLSAVERVPGSYTMSQQTSYGFFGKRVCQADCQFRWSEERGRPAAATGRPSSGPSVPPGCGYRENRRKDRVIEGPTTTI